MIRRKEGGRRRQRGGEGLYLGLKRNTAKGKGEKERETGSETKQESNLDYLVVKCTCTFFIQLGAGGLGCCH